MEAALTIELGLRIVIGAALLYTVLVAVTHWAVQRRHLQPFGAWPRFVRRVSDPVLDPIERRLVRMGRNPQNAPAWLFGLVIVAGILLIGLARWTIDAVHRLANADALGTEGIVLTLVGWAFGLMMIALIVRVVASWMGVSEYARWMRPVVLLTEWLLGPIRRRMPPLGMVDLSPLVAYFVLIVLRVVVTGLLAAVL